MASIGCFCAQSRYNDSGDVRMFQKLGQKFRYFMYGRYGMDPLGNFSLWAAIILMIIGLFTGSSLLYTLSILLLVWCYFRMFSRNQSKRLAENDKYMEIKDKFFGLFRGGSRTHRDKNYAYFRCPNCKQKVRVPKGKGTIEIRCPKCNTKFIKRT